MELARQPPPGEGESLRTVVIALVANAGIAAAKSSPRCSPCRAPCWPRRFTPPPTPGIRSCSCSPIAWRGDRLTRRTRLGHGREAYFWALVAALGMFMTGALLAVRQGIMELFHPVRVSSPLAAYVVLGIAFCLDGMSLMRAYRQLKREATRLDLQFLEHFDRSSDPVGRAVFAEDAVAMVGNLVAFSGIVSRPADRVGDPGCRGGADHRPLSGGRRAGLDQAEPRFPGRTAGLEGLRDALCQLSLAPAGRHGRRRALGDVRRSAAALGGGAHPDRRRARRPGDEAAAARDGGAVQAQSTSFERVYLVPS